MRPFTVFLLAVLLTAVSACRPAAKPVAVSDKPASINDVRQADAPAAPSKPLSEMSWTDFDGRSQKLKELEGKVVILDFWATNCPPCIEEIPHLNGLRAKYGDELRIVGMHVGDEEDKQKVPEFVQRLKISYPLAYPEDALIRFIFAARDDIPQTAVFDRKGIMIKKIVGFNSDIARELDSTVELAVNSR